MGVVCDGKYGYRIPPSCVLWGRRGTKGTFSYGDDESARNDIGATVTQHGR